MRTSTVRCTAVAVAVTLTVTFANSFAAWAAEHDVGDLRIFYSLRPIRHVNRVDGYPIALKFRLGSVQDVGWPELVVEGLGRTSRLDEPGWRLALLERLWKRRLDLEVVWENATDTNDRWLMADFENLAWFLVNKKDYRDYYQRQGFRAGMRLAPTAIFTFDVAYHNTRYTSLETGSPVTPATLVDGIIEWSRDDGERLASNRHIEPGRIAAVEAHVQARTLGRGSDPRSGLLFDLRGEFAGGSLGEDFKYILGELEIARHQAIAVRHRLDLHGRWSLSSRSLPPQRRRSLGGVGSIRGVQNRSMQGDRYVLGQLEYTFFISSLTAHAFFDVGATWLKKGQERDRQGEKRDLRHGYGVGVSWWPFRLYLAHGSRTPEVISQVIVRLTI